MDVVDLLKWQSDETLDTATNSLSIDSSASDGITACISAAAVYKVSNAWPRVECRPANDSACQMVLRTNKLQN